MKKNRTPLITGGIFLVLIGIYFMTSMNPREKTEGAIPLFPGEQPDIDKLEIYSSEHNKTVVEKKDGVWYLSYPLDYRASDSSVESTINTITKMVDDGVVSGRKESHTQFEVDDSTGVHLKVFSGGDVVLNAIIGKHSIDMNHTYARLADEDEVHLWRGLLQSHIDRQPNDWRDKTIYSFNVDDVMTVTSVTGRFEKKLVRSDSLWVYSENGSEKPVDQKNTNALVQLLATLRCDAFADEQDVPRAGSTEPDTEVRFTVRNGDEHVFHVWTPGEKDAGRYLLRKEGGDELFRFYRYRGAQVVIDYERLKPADKG